MKGQVIYGLHMVNIMAVVKKSINTETKSTKKATTRRVVNGKNTFTLDEKSMVLNIVLPVEWNSTHTVLKAKHITDVEGEKYKKLSFTDIDGNELYIFKTGFSYEPVVKEIKAPKVSKSDMSKLSDEEQAMLTLLLKKMSK